MTSHDTATLDRLADALRQAELLREPIAAPSSLVADLAIDDAYQIQRVNLERRYAAGERPVGHKVGLTSQAMQVQLGVDQPDFGVITDAMVIANGASVDVSEFIAPRVEPEFAFRIAVDLPPSPSIDQLRDAIGGVCIAIELIDSRVADWKITLVDTVADNASSARIICGEFLPATPALLASLPTTTIVLAEDGSPRTEGPGSAVLGDPVVSLHWLATAIGQYGQGFSAGDVVLAGAVAAALPLGEGSTWTAFAAGFDPAIVSGVKAGSGERSSQ